MPFRKWFEFTSTSSSFFVPYISLSYFSRCRIALVVVLLFTCVCLVSLVPVSQLCYVPGSQADLQIGSRFWRRGQQPSSTARPVALLWQRFEPSRWSADLFAELSSLGQGSPGSKPELLSVGVRMRALANLSTTVSLLLLRFDAYMPCRMAGAKPPSRPRCSSGRDGGLAAVCQRWQCSGHSLCGLPDSFWSSGHSLWSLARWTQLLDLSFWSSGHSLWTSAVEQRTQPCGALRKWTSVLR